MSQKTRRNRAEEIVSEVLKHIGARDTIRGALVNIERSINE
jgi:hypothetical protein